MTLGYLGEVHARSGEIDAACGVWSQALDAMDGVRSGRTRAVAHIMRSHLTPRPSGVAAAAEVNVRATEYLASDR